MAEQLTRSSFTPVVESVPSSRTGRLMVAGFVRQVVVPLAGFAAVSAVVAAIGARWRMLACVVAVLPVAVVVEWARTTHRAALAGRPIRPAAALAAAVVLLVGIVLAVCGIVAVLVDPSLINGAR